METKDIFAIDTCFTIRYAPNKDNGIQSLILKLHHSIEGSKWKNSRWWLAPLRDIPLSQAQIHFRSHLLKNILYYLEQIKDLKEHVTSLESTTTNKIKQGISIAIKEPFTTAVVDRSKGDAVIMDKTINSARTQYHNIIKNNIGTYFFSANRPKQLLTSLALIEVCDVLIDFINRAIIVSIDEHLRKFYPGKRIDPNVKINIGCEGILKGYSYEEFSEELREGHAGTDTHLLLFELKKEVVKYQNSMRDNCSCAHWPLEDISSKVMINNHQELLVFQFEPQTYKDDSAVRDPYEHNI